MERKWELALDPEPAGPSALRRFTRTSVHRLNFKRSSTASAAGSSTTTLDSLGNDKQPTSCAFKQTSGHDCDTLRFIVWVAVKRNQTEGITALQKRQCPLTQCQETFPNHDLMLQHLDSCTWLSDGEYLCHNCNKSERFSASKGRRCLEHPSRKRKIVSMAKNFFSSLGHKPRPSTVVDLDLVDDDMPNFHPLEVMSHSIMASDQVHEMDSCGTQLSTIPEVAEDMRVSYDGSLWPSSDSSTKVPSRVSATGFPSQQGVSHASRSHPAELDATLVTNNTTSMYNSSQDSGVVAPQDLLNDQWSVLDKPTPHPRSYAQYSSSIKSRSKVLAPSTSVRSTCSTNSTASTGTQFSAVSACSYDTTLTTPADDDISFADMLPDPQFDGCQDPFPELDGNMDDAFDYDTFMDDLPGNLPMVMPNRPIDQLQDEFALEFPNAILPTEPVELPVTTVTMPGNTDQQQPPQQLLTGATGDDTAAQNLISSARAALEEHIAESQSKLKHMLDNEIARQFVLMLSDAITSQGLETLKEILNGRLPSSPVKLLCFVHVVYAFFLVMDVQDMERKCRSLFVQALSYGPRALGPDVKAWTRIVTTLWQPDGLTTDTIRAMTETKFKQATQELDHAGAKQPQTLLKGFETDSLLLIAQIFLDELEYHARHTTSPQPSYPGDAYAQLLNSAAAEQRNDAPYFNTEEAISGLAQLSRQYHDAPAFIEDLSRLSDLVNLFCVSTPRRLEVELMHLGNDHLKSEYDVEQYREEVLRLTHTLCGPNLSQQDYRRIHYIFAARLVESMLYKDRHREDAIATAASQTDEPLDGLDEVLADLALDLNESSTATMAGSSTEVTPPYSASNPDIPLDCDSGDELLWGITPEKFSSGTVSSEIFATPQSPNTTASPAKIESGRCCETCGYRPKGDPKWFAGSMAKHKRLMHAPNPPKIYKCPFPNCKSQYKSRPDNLRQHQIEKNHFVDGDESRPKKRKKTTNDE